MKKTKLFTSIAALALVLGLGACDLTEEEETPDETGETTETGEVTETGDTSDTGTSEGGNEGGEGNDYEDNYFNSIVTAVAENHNYTAETVYYIYQSEGVSVNYEGTVSLYPAFMCGYDFYATEDALEIDYIEYLTTADGVYQDGWYYVDLELYVNDYVNNKTNVYYLNSNATSMYDIYLYTTWDGTWEDNIYNLAYLAPYRSAFTVSSSYYGIEDYDVDESAYEMLMNTTIANTYFWDQMFYEAGYGYYGMNEYMNGPQDFDYAEADQYGVYGYGPFVEFGFDTGATWYYTDYTYQSIYAQETIAYVDISDVGTTEIDSNLASYLIA